VVEQQPFKLWVDGSSPSRLTRLLPNLRFASVGPWDAYPVFRLGSGYPEPVEGRMAGHAFIAGHTPYNAEIPIISVPIV
jgi:hypothetical protein